jgi:hypothetical protein
MSEEGEQDSQHRLRSSMSEEGEQDSQHRLRSSMSVEGEQELSLISTFLFHERFCVHKWMLVSTSGCFMSPQVDVCVDKWMFVSTSGCS